MIKFSVMMAVSCTWCMAFSSRFLTHSRSLARAGAHALSHSRALRNFISVARHTSSNFCRRHIISIENKFGQMCCVLLWLRYFTINLDFTPASVYAVTDDA